MSESQRCNSRTIGDRLRRAREETSLSREALAAEIGVSVSTIVRAELRGKLPGTLTTAAICRRLELSLDELLSIQVPA